MNLALRLLDRRVDGGALADQDRPPAASDTTPRAEGARPAGGTSKDLVQSLSCLRMLFDFLVVDSLAQLAAVPAKALKLEILNSRPHNNLVDLNVAGLFDGICYRSGTGVGRDCDLIEVLHIL